MTLNCNGKILDLSTKKIMGIVNVSNDSFYDGGQYNSIDKVNSRINDLVSDGAEIIDIGAASSKPGSKLINAKEELKIISDYIIEISNNFNNVHLSIDTYNSDVAEFALKNGFSIINDISSGKYDLNMYDVIKEYNAGYIMMHMQGNPDNMQDNPEYDNVVESIISFFKDKINELESFGIQNIILDPGFGFGKTIKDNFKILNELSLFQSFKKPLLVGLSRKSMIYKLLDTSPNKALNGTTVLNTLAIEKGADILRVHDAKEASECIKLMENLD